MATGLSAEVPPEQWAAPEERGLPSWGQSFEILQGLGSSSLLRVVTVDPVKRNALGSGRFRQL